MSFATSLQEPLVTGEEDTGLDLAAARLDFAIDRGMDALLKQQKKDGHWAFELEADATIPAEYILLQHYLDEIDAPLQAKMANYLRDIQGEHGGWPLFYAGAFNLSASVKAYFALKAVGDSKDAPHMVRARQAILAAGGAERTNVFTRIQLALFGQVPWRAVPVMPVEIMNLPRWFPFHLDKVSYWSRTVIVPLLVLMAKKPQAKNPRQIQIRELFTQDPETITDWIRGPYRSKWGHIFGTVDKVLAVVEWLFPASSRNRAIARAVAFVTERLNGEDGLGAIYPAMANSVMMYECLGYAKDHPNLLIAKQSLQKLLVVDQDRAYCQPCLSPVWDTGLAGHALAEVGGAGIAAAARGAKWLQGKQVLDVVGDWAVKRPQVRPGGWAFQYANAHYPDVDDTAVVGMLLDRVNDPQYAEAIARAEEWILGLQSKNGGWGAFDADNTYHYLNHIPFADHGALLDPPTADVTARCLSFLAQRGYTLDSKIVRDAVNFLRDDQEEDGSWYGRWGTNYIYGTWSVLCALNAIGLPHDDPAIARAADWLVSKQREDGGWGEDCDSYDAAPAGEYHCSNPSQTAWALLGLMAAGKAGHAAVTRGIDHLIATQRGDGEWEEKPYTAVGFAKVFYLRYHGYKQFFPVMALARHRNLQASNSGRVAWGF
jgi:squalene-hopene/tetraprenyl-beta-curcumene cyclase